MPMVMLAGATVRVTCFVPWHGDNRLISFGIDGISTATTEIDRVQYTQLFERIECGTWMVRCTVVDNLGKVSTRSQVIEPRGMCNGG